MGTLERNGTQIGTRKILTPNSYKLNVDMHGFRYSGPNTRVAIGAFFVYKGSVAKRDSSSTEAEEERPDDNTKNQRVMTVSDSSQTAGFFSWDKYVNATSVSGTSAIVPIASSSIMAETNTDDLEVDAGWKVVRVWFTPDGQPESISWDPSIGVAEEAESSASTCMV